MRDPITATDCPVCEGEGRIYTKCPHPPKGPEDCDCCQLDSCCVQYCGFCDGTGSVDESALKDYHEELKADGRERE